jgi:hypothetical protein
MGTADGHNHSFIGEILKEEEVERETRAREER